MFVVVIRGSGNAIVLGPIKMESDAAKYRERLRTRAHQLGFVVPGFTDLKEAADGEFSRWRRPVLNIQIMSLGVPEDRPLDATILDNFTIDPDLRRGEEVVSDA